MGRGKTASGSALGASLALLGVTVLIATLAGAPAAGALGFVQEWGQTGAGPGQFRFPVSVAVDATGTVYVADSENDRIQRFDESGAFLGEWGGTGAGPGQFSTPEAVDVDASGNVYVADKGNFRIQKFTPTGSFLAQWGSHGSADGQFEAPEGIATDAAGNVYVADAGNNRIEKFTAAGAFVTNWGAPGKAAGQFDGPDGVAVDAAGNVYVSDSGNDRIQKFTTAGAFVTKWGKTGDDPGELDFPVAVATDAAGRVYVADAGNDRIQVFGKLSKPQYGKSVNLGVVSGIVRVHLPGSTKFTVLGTDQQLPVGTIVDASHGRVRLSSSKGPGGGTQSADFYSGAFRVLQPKGGKPITVLKLENGLVCPIKKGKRELGGGLARSRNRGLWGSGKGNFRSEGKHGSATVRGTIWWAQDTCEGTLFKVKKGVVTIKDFTSGKTLKLHAGQHYLAPNG
jgi:DNA-binding beta-propeller fold protein YncE